MKIIWFGLKYIKHYMHVNKKFCRFFISNVKKPFLGEKFGPDQFSTLMFFIQTMKQSIYWKESFYQFILIVWLCLARVSTGILGYGLRTEMIRKFFPFPLWKRFRKSGIPERFLSVNRKFPGRCSGITERYRIVFRKIPVYGTIVPEFSGKKFRKTLNTS